MINFKTACYLNVGLTDHCMLNLRFKSKINYMLIGNDENTITKKIVFIDYSIIQQH